MEYKIPFRGLKEGKHQYELSIDDRFFELFPEGDIQKGKLEVKVEIIKRSTGIEAMFIINGFVTLPCDRCLDELDCTIDSKNKLFFEFGLESVEVTDELVMLSPGENYLELDKYIYEYIILSLPIQKVHGDDENGNSLCNADMLEKLKSMTVKNDDDEIDDPRWDQLRDLIN